jgi:peroxiredoxin
MPALEAGVEAPPITLKDLDGKEFSLEAARRRGPVVLAFFKINCPVCQLAMPFLERLYKAYGASGKFTLMGVSQNDVADTRAFNQKFRMTLPMLNDSAGFTASRAYQLTNVPTVFMVSPEGGIEFSSVSWSKDDMEDLNRRLAAVSGGAETPLFHASDSVPAFQPG